jgi:hypothetical protein
VCAVTRRRFPYLRDDVPKQEDWRRVCLDAGKNRTMQARFYRSEGSGRASLAVHLVNKAPKEHLDVREPSHLGNVGHTGL